MKKFLFWLVVLGALFGLTILSATVTMNLASRRDEVITPDLRGMDIVGAMEAIEKLRLNLKVNGKEFDDTLPPGTIISHHPGPGQNVRQGRSIEAIISVGPRQVGVPEMRGEIVLRAQSNLLQNGLRVGRVAKLASDRAGRDIILGQSPAPPSAIEKHTPVDLLVSSGPPAVLYVMPDFIGQSLARTVRGVQEAGLEIAEIGYQEYPGASPGTVINQLPGLGTPVRLGDRLAFTVSGTSAPGDSRKGRHALLTFNVPAGFRPRRVRVEVESERGSRELMDETRQPGDRVQLLVEIDGRTKANIYLDDTLADTRHF
jgi:serine/threonine-protein kinase